MASPDVLSAEELEGEGPDVLDAEDLESATEWPAFARQLGKELATSIPTKGAGIGGALGAAFGMPTAGAAIGAGIEKLIEPKAPAAPKPVKPAPTTRIPEAEPTEWPFMKPAVEASPEEQIKSGTLGQFLKERGATDLAKPIKELEPEEGPVLQAPRGPKTTSIGLRSLEGVPEEIPFQLELKEKEERIKPVEGPATETVRELFGSRISEKVLGPSPVYDKAKLEAELGEMAALGEIKWPTIPGVARRVETGVEELVRKIGGESAARGLEEKGLLATLIDLQENGLIVTGKQKPKIENIDPFEPRPKDPQQAALWDQIYKYPELLKEAKRRWTRIRAQREARGVPVSDEGLKDESWWQELKKQQAPAYEEQEKQEKGRPSSGWMLPIQVPLNFANELTDILVSMTQAVVETVGPGVAPETPEVQAARQRLKEAKRGGDEQAIKDAEEDLDEIQQRAIGAKVGAGFGSMPGQIAAVLHGLTKPNFGNSLIKNPAQVLMILDGFRASKKWVKAKAPKVDAAINKFGGVVKKYTLLVLDKVIPDWVGEAKETLKQYIADSVLTGKTAWNQIMDNLFNGKKGAVDMLREQMRRELAAGNVQIAEKSVKPVDVWIRPEAKARDVAAATRQAEAARTKAEKLADIGEMSKETSQKARDLEVALNTLTRKADSVQRQIVEAGEKVDRTELRKRLNELRYAQRKVELELKAERVRSRYEGRAKIEAEKAVKIGTKIAEEGGALPKLKGYAGEEAAAVAAAEAVPPSLQEVGTIPEQRQLVDDWQSTIDDLAKKRDSAKNKASKQALQMAIESSQEQLTSLNELLAREQATGQRPLSEKSREYIKASQEARKAAMELFKKAQPKEQIDAFIQQSNKAKAAIARAMRESERLEDLAREARKEGEMSQEEFAQQVKQTQRYMEDLKRTQAGKGLAAGVEMAEAAKQVSAEGAPAALTEEARRAAARLPSIIEGAKRTAKTLEENVAKTEAREEILGRMYVPEDVLPKDKLRLDQALDRARFAQEEARSNPTEENLRKGRQATRDIQTLEDAQKGVVRVSDYRNAADLALRAAIDAQQRVLNSNENLVDMERRSQSPRTTVTQADLEKARLENQQARLLAEDATNKVEQTKRAYELVRDTELPNKIAEITSEMDVEDIGGFTDALLSTGAHRVKIIDDLIDEASAYKQKAREAGANLEVPASPEAIAMTQMPEGSSLYQVARRFAEHLTDLNADVAAYMREFLIKEGVERGAAEAGNWLAKEIEAQKALVGMVEPQFGVRRRPVATEEVSTISPTGVVTPRAQALGEQFTEAVKPGEQATGIQKQMEKALREMREMRTTQETPKAFTTNNERFNNMLREYAQEIIRLGYDLPVTNPELGAEPNAFLNVSERLQRKMLTEETVMSRLLEALQEDTMQPFLHSTELRRSILNQVGDRLEKAGMDSKFIGRALVEVRKLLVDEKRLSFHSKNRFPDLVYEGEPILTRKDFVDAMDKADPKVTNAARAGALDYIASKQAAAAQTYGMLHSMNDEYNRFRLNPDGSWKKNSLTGKEPVDASTYAIQVAEDMINNNEPPPMLMPYSGSIVADQLSRVAEMDRWTPEQRAKLYSAAEDIRKQKPVDQALKNVIGTVYSRVFEGTDAAPPNMDNMHIDPVVSRAMRAHFASLVDATDLGDIANAIQGVARFTKKGVVPMNLRALVNNNLSNSLLQVLTRGGVNFMPSLFSESYKFNKFISGKHEGLSDYDMQMYDSIARRNALFRTEFKKLYGENPAWAGLKERFGTLAKLEAAIESGDFNWMYLPESYGKFRDFMVDMYTKAGDAPFRLEEMVHVYNDFYDKLEKMEPGTVAQFPITPYENIKLTKLEDGSFEATDPMGRQPAKKLGAGSKELSDVLAKAADVAQESKFLNPERMGLWFKALQSTAMQPISGIFTWAAGALDIPFIKKGLVSRMMEGPVAMETNSPRVLTEQAKQFSSWWLKRAAMISGSQAAFANQQAMEDVRRSLGYNQALTSVVVAPGVNPAYLRMRNTAPLLFSAPTTSAMNALAGAVDWMRFSPSSPFTNPDYLAKIQSADVDWERFTPEQVELLKRNKPEIGEYAEEMRRLAKEDPEAYKYRALVKRDMTKWAAGEISNREDLLRLIGLTGSPLLQWAKEMSEGKKTSSALLRQFGSMVFGATPFSMADVAAALAGKAGADSMEKYTSYGSTISKSGEYEDSSTMMEWAIAQLFGIGWNQVFYGTGGESPDDPRGYPRLKSYLNRFDTELNNSVLNELKKRTREPLGADATEQEKIEHQNLVAAYKLIKGGMDRFKDKMERAIKEQQKMLVRPKQQPTKD